MAKAVGIETEGIAPLVGDMHILERVFGAVDSLIPVRRRHPNSSAVFSARFSAVFCVSFCLDHIRHRKLIDALPPFLELHFAARTRR